MKTYIFRQSNLINASRLNDRQLPLLSCMAGNSLISANDLKIFHNDHFSSCSRENHFHIRDVILFIKRNKLKGNEEEFPKVAKTLQITENLLRKGMLYYDITSSKTAECEPQFSSVREESADCSIPAPLYILLRLRKYREGISMEDPHDEHLPSSAKIFRPIRQRMYYLLYEGKLTDVEEYCCACKLNISIEPENVRLLSIDIEEEIPPLNDLLFGNVDEEIRWKLFAACMELTIPVSCLKVIEPRFVVLCSILNFLIQNENIGLEDWEVKSFIYQAVYRSCTDISSIKVNEISSRPVSLSGILLRGITTIIKVIPVCGYPIPFKEAMPWKYLEGEAFHYAYNLLKNSNSDEAIMKLCENNESTTKQLLALYRLTVTGTHLAEENSNIIER